jgi:hypothetical protein
MRIAYSANGLDSEQGSVWWQPDWGASYCLESE